jgi:drug/metabolite transporter (DMT)-like permease
VRDRTTVTAFVICALLAGGNGVGVRFSNHELAPLWGATLRFGVAAAVLFAIVLLRGIALPRGRALVGALVYGLLAFALTFALLYWGLQRAGAGLAQIVLALVPLLTFLLAVAQRLERFAWQVLGGSLVAVAGIGIVFVDQVGGTVPLMSLLAVLGGAAAMAESNVAIKRFPRAHPMATNAVAMGGAFVVLLAVSFAAGEPHAVPSRLETWAAVAYVSVIGSVTVFSLFLFIIERWSASATSYVMLIVPLVTVAASAALDHETVTWAYLVGGPLVLAGVYLGAFAPPLRRLVPRRVAALAGGAADERPMATGIGPPPRAWRAVSTPSGLPQGSGADGSEPPCVENPGCA